MPSSSPSSSSLPTNCVGALGLWPQPQQRSSQLLVSFAPRSSRSRISIAFLSSSSLPSQDFLLSEYLRSNRTRKTESKRTKEIEDARSGTYLARCSGEEGWNLRRDLFSESSNSLGETLKASSLPANKLLPSQLSQEALLTTPWLT